MLYFTCNERMRECSRNQGRSREARSSSVMRGATRLLAVTALTSTSPTARDVILNVGQRGAEHLALLRYQKLRRPKITISPLLVIIGSSFISKDAIRYDSHMKR